VPNVDNIKLISDVSNNSTYNRFFQILTRNIYSPITCKWIINEYEKVEKTFSNVLAEQNQNAFSFILFSFKDLIDFFVKSYNLNKDIKITIANCRVLKYNNSNIVSNGFLCIISLSQSTLFVYNNGLTYQLEQGDLLICKNPPSEIINKNNEII